jgi:hypothetical protein
MNQYINNKNGKRDVATRFFAIQPHMDRKSLFKISHSLNTLMTNSFLEEPTIMSNPKIYKRLSIQACTILNDLRSNNQLCDSIIRVDDGTEFPIHRAVLSGKQLFFF